jgi:transcription elongation factor GreA
MSTVVRRPCLITREGHLRLQDELNRLVSTERRALAEALREAREDGAEPENSSVAVALDQLGALECRIGELEAMLSVARIADPPPDGVAGIGRRVQIRMAGGAEPRDYHLVGALECDPERSRISVESPVGEALVGRRAGEVVEVDTPGGLRTVEIVAVGEAEA